MEMSICTHHVLAFVFSHVVVVVGGGGGGGGGGA